MEWPKYTTKETLKDNDELMILDKEANANKRTLMNKVWNYVVDKMTSAVVAKLTTENKTMIGAINELNSNSLKDLVETNRYGDMTIKTTGSTMSFQVNWKGTLHRLVYNTNDALVIKTSEDGGQTWTTKRTL